MATTRNDLMLAAETVRLRKALVNARLRVEEALRLAPNENLPLRQKLQKALAALEAASPGIAEATAARRP